MKKLIATILCLMMLVCAVSAATAGDVTLPIKMERQMQHDGNGLKGSFTIEANADAVKDPLIYAVQNAEYSILRNASGKDWHLIIFQTDESEQQYNLSELYQAEESLYFRSDMLPGKVIALSPEALLATFVIVSRGENPDIVPAVLSMFNMKDADREAWEPVAARYGKMLEIWMGEYITEPEMISGGDGPSRMNLTYVVPYEDACKEFGTLIASASADPDVIALLSGIMTDEERAIYLNPALGDFYAEALKGLGITDDIRFVKTVTALGEMIASEIVIPLPAAVTGYSSLTIASRNHTTAYTLNGDEQAIRVIIPEDAEELIAQTEYEMTAYLIRCDKKKTDLNIACKVDIKRTTENSYDNETSREHETHHYIISAARDTENLPEGVTENMIPETETIDAQLDLHYSGKTGANSPTTLEMTLKLNRGDLDVSVNGKIKTSSTWPFLPFSVDQPEKPNAYTEDVITGYLTEWTQHAITDIRHLDLNPQEQIEVVNEGE